jgi:mRNA interferase MazF
MNISYSKASFLACLPDYFFLKEEPWIYGSSPSQGPDFEPGDIVEIPFPYTDLSGFKTRPALVMAISRMDITVAFISTHLSWMAYEDFILLPGGNTGLKSPSVVRISKLFSIDPKLVFRKIGQTESMEMEAAIWCLKTYFSSGKWPGSAGIKEM